MQKENLDSTMEYNTYSQIATIRAEGVCPMLKS